MMLAMKTPLVLILLAWTILLCPIGCAQRSSGSDVLATGNEVEIHREQLMDAADEQLKELELERERFEAGMIRRRHEILEKTLKGLVETELLTLEAESRNITTVQLLAGLREATSEPTQKDVDDFWQANAGRINGKKEDFEDRIRTHLESQAMAQAQARFVNELADKYEVEYLLEPLRFEIASDGFPTLGPPDAPVTVVEFSDFQCPYCATVGPTLKKLTEEYGDKVRLVFRQFPLSRIHPQAMKAAEASLCAADQGKFWELHDAMFADQKKLGVDDLRATAAAIGLDVVAFNACLDAGKYAEAVQTDLKDATRVGVTGTPAFFVNGRPLSGAVPYETIAEAVDKELEQSGD
jgi:predicted DsbA family dithiol-disulfide isomerase